MLALIVAPLLFDFHLFDDGRFGHLVSLGPMFISFTMLYIRQLDPLVARRAHDKPLGLLLAKFRVGREPEPIRRGTILL